MLNNIIAVVGLCGSGKSVVCGYLKEKGYYTIHFGGLTMDELKRLNLPVNESNERFVREKIRKEHGMNAYAILSLSKIESAISCGDKVLIDGLYSFSEYKILKKNYGDNLVLLAIFTPKSLRYSRLASRTIRPIKKEDAQKRDYAEIENIEKGGPISIADYTIINDKSINDLKSKVDLLLNQGLI